MSSIPLIPYCCIFSSEMLWSSVSNAFCKSIKTPQRNCLLSVALSIWTWSKLWDTFWLNCGHWHKVLNFDQLLYQFKIRVKIISLMSSKNALSIWTWSKLWDTFWLNCGHWHKVLNFDQLLYQFKIRVKIISLMSSKNDNSLIL